MKIKHIISAQQGWVAMFKSGENIVESSVAVWAIVSGENGDRVVGYSSSGDEGLSTEDTECCNFIGYTLKSNNP